MAQRENCKLQDLRDRERGGGESEREREGGTESEGRRGGGRRERKRERDRQADGQTYGLTDKNSQGQRIIHYTPLYQIF